ncbi:alpha/beta-hydrolase [Polychaeton citri CBS 116435]|uniref:Alpha/beta-hydrolase n=1 Tax=Polychaeton citri CBS 116435 TaxID=1314669 RepID=A0A9P4Q0Q3_9PEZI|nr:alpha/beta-hydrolase [Polychaeton citri CBS 116435]
MNDISLAYKQDRFGNNLDARIVWKDELSSVPKPVVLVLHAGGLIVGNSNILPKPQIDYLLSLERSFVMVVPEYRLAPQADGKTSYQDCIDAYDWILSSLSKTMSLEHSVQLDVNSISTLGHSIGGTLAMHVASLRAVKAVTALYPSLSLADTTASAHLPTSAPPFGNMPDYTPTDEEWAAISPDNIEISNCPLALPGSIPAPRNRWQMQIIRKGQWMSTICPDGDFAALDPLTRLGDDWPSTLIVQGEDDNIPGSSLALAERTITDMKIHGVKQARLVSVKGATHMFDLMPAVGTTDLGEKWQAVKEGLDHLSKHA